MTITSPANDASYIKGQTVSASYGCQEGLDGPRIASCSGTIANGAAIDTSTAGSHTFTATATSSDGQSTTISVSYTVVLPPNNFTVSHIKTHRDGEITLDVTVPGPGSIEVLETVSER